MLPLILLGVTFVLLVLAYLIVRQPADFRIARSTTVAAPPAAALDLVEDFHEWKRWSPWDALDPTQVVTHGGAERGVGATYAWVGKKNGEGRMEILEVQPGARVTIQLDFIKPFKAHNRCEFTARPAAGGSEVTWTMTGSNDFVGKAFHFFMNMDRMVGPDFERGLANLKREAEGTTGAPGGAGTSASASARRAPA